jgi:hypothetical protein
VRVERSTPIIKFVLVAGEGLYVSVLGKVCHPLP